MTNFIIITVNSHTISHSSHSAKLLVSYHANKHIYIITIVSMCLGQETENEKLSTDGNKMYSSCKYYYGQNTAKWALDIQYTYLLISSTLHTLRSMVTKWFSAR